MLQWIKQLFTTQEYNQASIRMMDTMGDRGSNRPPFNYQAAVRGYRSWVYAAAHINATAVAATPLRLFIRSKSETKSMWRTRPISKSRRAYMYGDLPGDVSPSRKVMTKVMDLGDDFEEVTETHPIIEVLQKANGVYNGFDLTVLRTLYQELTGNAYLHPVYDERLGVPQELWPMPPQWMQVIPSREEFIDGYLYGRTDVEALRFERDEVIHFKRPNPDNLFYGLGKVEAAYGTVQANAAVHEMDLAMFENHARPDYAVVVNGPARRNDLDMFEQHVSERLRGTRKTGQFLAVSGDVKFEALNFPPKDISGREEIVEEIAAVFGVPVSMLKANDPNLASARAGFGQWRESTVLPMLRMDEDVLNQILLPMFGIEDDAVLCYDNPVPADKEYELRQRQTAVAGGWQTLNEARLEQGMEQSDNDLANELLVNGMPLGQQQPQFGASPFGASPFGAIPPSAPQDAPVVNEEQEVEAQEQQAEISESLALNGAQIASIVEVLQNISSGVIAREAGIEVIVATGIGREQANNMVEAQQVEAKPVEPEPESKQVLPSPEEIEGELFDTPEEAEVRADELGCSGHHVHETNQGPKYMPCSDMGDYTNLTGIAHDKNCGIGSGGFESGNDCASEDGSSTTEADKEDDDSEDYADADGDLIAEIQTDWDTAAATNEDYIEGKITNVDGKVVEYDGKEGERFSSAEVRELAGLYQGIDYREITDMQRGIDSADISDTDLAERVESARTRLVPESGETGEAYARRMVEHAARATNRDNSIETFYIGNEGKAAEEFRVQTNMIADGVLSGEIEAAGAQDIYISTLENYRASVKNERKTLLNNFSNAIRGNITSDGSSVELYRGCGERETQAIWEHISSKGVGSTITLDTTTSTTTNVQIAKQFSRRIDHDSIGQFVPNGKEKSSNTVLKIKAKSGAMMQYMRKEVTDGVENEVLLPKGTSYKITKVRSVPDRNKTHVVYLEEVEK